MDEKRNIEYQNLKTNQDASYKIKRNLMHSAFEFAFLLFLVHS